MLNKLKIHSFTRLVLLGGLLMLQSIASFGQAPDLKTRLYGNVNSEDIGKGVDGAKINVYRNDSKVETITTDSRGKFDFTIEPGAVYKLEFEYPNHVTKRMQVDTRSVTPESEWGGEFKFDMDLFEKRDGLNVSVLNKPIAKLFFNSELGTIDFDKEYTASIKSEVDRLRTELDAKLKAEAEEKKQLEQAYSKAIADADKAMLSEDYLKAKQEYSRASGYKPNEAYPKDKLKEAQQKYDAAQSAKNQENEYKEAIESAEFALYQNDTKKALDEFERALTIKPGDKYAKDQAKELQDKLMNQAKSEQEYLTAIQKADAALSAKDLLTAKGEYQKAIEAKPSEEYPKGQLEQVTAMIKADAEKEQNYIKSIERADNAMEIKDYESAKAAFMQAAEIKPQEKYPKDQITKIDKIIAELAALNKTYDDALKVGDAAFNKEDFTAAKTAYNKAAGLKPDEKYPKDQLAAIEKREIELANINSQYNDIIKEADNRYNIKEFVAAKAEYTKAVQLKPNEEYPKTRLAEVTAKLEEQAKIDQEYKAAIENADNAFNANDFLSAKIEYENASKLKPNEAYPKEQLQKANDQIAAKQAAEQQYEEALKTADAAFKEERLEDARLSYQKASELKPKEEYPKSQLGIIAQKLVELENQNKEYAGLIATADKAFDAADYQTATENYKSALAIKPTENHPKDRIAKIDELLQAAKKLDENYQLAIESGDKAFKAADYNAAKTEYQKASALKPEEKYPTDRISEIEGLLLEMAAKDQEYNNLISKADAAFSNNELDESRTAYQEALKLKAEEEYPKKQLAQIEAKVKAAEEADAAYAAAIQNAENAEKSGELTAALDGFAEASKIKPEEQYPKDKMAELKKLAAENQKLETAYADAIKLADEAFSGKEYDIATTSYTKASELKPQEEYPKTKLQEIATIKAEQAAAIELANKTQAEYDKLISDADAAFGKDEFEAARKAYQSALGLKADEAYPKDQLAKIDEAIKTRELAAAAQEEMKAKRERYEGVVANADKAFGQEDYESAIASYKEAKAILPEENYPTDQIAKIEKIKADKQAEIALANQQLEEKYKGLIATADVAYAAKDFQKAEQDYRAALEVKPAEKYPQDQIALIKNSLADQEAKENEYNGMITAADKSFKSGAYAEAITSYESALTIKPNETYPVDQVKESKRLLAELENAKAREEGEAQEKARQEQYDGFIAAADKSFKAKDYENASKSYQQALDVKEGEPYPSEQLAEIERLKAEAQALAEQEKNEAAQREKQDKYDAFIEKADNALSARDYEVARSNYNSALEVMPAEQYPKDKLNEMDRLIAEEAARLAAEKNAAAQKELDEKYQAFVDVADKSFKSKEYEAAKTNYKAALEVKPSESYPKTQLTEIDRLIKEAADSENQKRLAEEAAAKEKRYKELITSGDKSVKSADWQAAKQAFEEAKGIKPDESYPPEQLVFVNQKLSEQIALQNQEGKYNDLIAKADAAYGSEDYNSAKNTYQEALGIKPNETYPQQQLTLIDEALAAMNADKKRMEEERRKEEARYKDAIALADRYFETESYKDASEQYKAALEIKPEELYPKDQLNKITDLIAAKASDEDAKKERERMLADYQAQVDKGDRSFSRKDYIGAKSAYQAALKIMPAETYPKNQLQKIKDALDKEKQVAVVPVEKPRAKVTGKSEEDIAAMMAELKRKREQEKLDRLNKIQKDLSEIEDDRIAQAKTERENANSDLNQLQESINQDREEKKEGYFAKVEEVEVFTEIVEDAQKKRVERADDRREDALAELNDLEKERLEAFKEGNELRMIGAEKVFTKKIELEQEEDRRQALAEEKRTSEENEINRLAEGIRERNEGGEEVRQSSIQSLKDREKDIAAKNTTDKKQADGRRVDALEEEINLRQELKEQHLSGDEMHRKNAVDLESSTEKIVDARNQAKKSADEKRLENYDKIIDYVDDVDKLTEEKYNNYQKNNEMVLARQDQIVEYNKQLSAKANDRRNNYNPDYYVGEKLPRKSDKASQYTQGITEETYEDGNAIVLKRIKVEGETLDEYEKIHYPWGGVFYKKNGQDITAEIWDAETK